jgi:hypothetical protein
MGRGLSILETESLNDAEQKAFEMPRAVINAKAKMTA